MSKIEESAFFWSAFDDWMECRIEGRQYDYGDGGGDEIDGFEINLRPEGRSRWSYEVCHDSRGGCERGWIVGSGDEVRREAEELLTAFRDAWEEWADGKEIEEDEDAERAFH